MSAQQTRTFHHTKAGFPHLLTTKEYGPATHSGSKVTSLYPFSMEKDLSKLPEEVEQRSVESEVQRTLLQTLSTMHYNAPAIKAAAWPKRNEQLPPGASYTCGAREGVEDGQPQREQQRKQQEWV